MNPKVRLGAGLAAQLLHRRQQLSLPQPVAALPFGWAVRHVLVASRRCPTAALLAPQQGSALAACNRQNTETAQCPIRLGSE